MGAVNSSAVVHKQVMAAAENIRAELREALLRHQRSGHMDAFSAITFADLRKALMADFAAERADVASAGAGADSLEFYTPMVLRALLQVSPPEGLRSQLEAAFQTAVDMKSAIGAGTLLQTALVRQEFVHHVLQVAATATPADTMDMIVVMLGVATLRPNTLQAMLLIASELPGDSGTFAVAQLCRALLGAAPRPQAPSNDAIVAAAAAHNVATLQALIHAKQQAVTLADADTNGALSTIIDSLLAAPPGADGTTMQSRYRTLHFLLRNAYAELAPADVTAMLVRVMMDVFNGNVDMPDAEVALETFSLMFTCLGQDDWLVQVPLALCAYIRGITDDNLALAWLCLRIHLLMDKCHSTYRGFKLSGVIAEAAQLAPFEAAHVIAEICAYSHREVYTHTVRPAVFATLRTLQMPFMMFDDWLREATADLDLEAVEGIVTFCDNQLVVPYNGVTPVASLLAEGHVSAPLLAVWTTTQGVNRLRNELLRRFATQAFPSRKQRNYIWETLAALASLAALAPLEPVSELVFRNIEHWPPLPEMEKPKFIKQGFQMGALSVLTAIRALISCSLPADIEDTVAWVLALGMDAVETASSVVSVPTPTAYPGQFLLAIVRNPGFAMSITNEAAVALLRLLAEKAQATFEDGVPLVDVHRLMLNAIPDAEKSSSAFVDLLARQQSYATNKAVAAMYGTLHRQAALARAAKMALRRARTIMGAASAAAASAVPRLLDRALGRPEVADGAVPRFEFVNDVTQVEHDAAAGAVAGGPQYL